MKLEPAGHRVIVKPDPLSALEEKEMQQYESLQKLNFEIADAKDKKRKQSAVHTGTLVAIGVNAWKAYDDGIPWAKVGDRVHFAKYGGYVCEEDGVQYRVLNDEDITAIVREEAA
jgi:co-chaperonin GroES (HSP10)